jgi:hypothetical protein
MTTTHVVNLKTPELRAELRLLDSFRAVSFASIYGAGTSKEERSVARKVRISNLLRRFEICEELERRGV